MEIMESVVVSLILVGVGGEAVQDNLGSYSHYLDSKSFIYNSGLGASSNTENVPEQPKTEKSNDVNSDAIKDKRDAVIEEYRTSQLNHYASLYSPYFNPLWLAPEYQSVQKEEIYKRNAHGYPDLNGPPPSSLGYPGIHPSQLYSYPYINPYLSQYPPPPDTRAYTPPHPGPVAPVPPVYNPPDYNTSPAPVYRYNPTPVPSSVPVPVYRFSPLPYSTPPTPNPPPAPTPVYHPPPTAPPAYNPPPIAPPAYHPPPIYHPPPTAPPVYIPPAKTPSVYHPPAPSYIPPRSDTPQEPAAPPLHPLAINHNPSHPFHKALQQLQQPQPQVHHHHLNPQDIVTLPPSQVKEPQTLPIPTFPPQHSFLPKAPVHPVSHSQLPPVSPLNPPQPKPQSPSTFSRLSQLTDSHVPNTLQQNPSFLPLQNQPQTGSNPVLIRNPSLMSKNEFQEQERPATSIHRPHPPPAPQRPKNPPLVKSRPPPKPKQPRPPAISGTFQNQPSPSRPRTPRSRALENLLDVAGDNWNPDLDINTNLISETIGTNFVCPAREGHFPDPNNCKDYYQCDHGVAHKNSCGDGLVWNIVIEQCDWSTSVDCSFDRSFQTRY